MSFREFFQKATRSVADPNGRIPFPYQERFAEAESIWQLVRAPTGAGKTATLVVGWAWRLFESGKPTPRRLVYCLPMRVLVEQTEREARQWLENLGLAERAKIHVLMGGVEAESWFSESEQPALLIGTQDMLLSRALNRGYGASRFHWPIDFALLNNDCHWVFDEPQLMANGLSTSAQLAGLRRALGTFAQSTSTWMSATLEPTWLDTIDFRGMRPAEALELGAEDYAPGKGLYQRMTATKTLTRLGPSASKDMKLASKAVLDRHVVGTQTLVVVNTVERAKAVYVELKKLRKNSAMPRILLVHSRFRPHERRELNAQLQDKREAAVDRIIVATQVIEAGVDISSRTLVTELAPWASVVQRIGRCNRTGDDGPGQALWIDVDDKLSPPYSTAALDFARKHLERLEAQTVSPKALDDYKKANETPDEPFLSFDHKHVLRRRDLLDLFDTSPDLSGNDVDVQRFVRSDDLDADVQVFWRDLTADDWDASPRQAELCSVPVGSIKAFLKKDKGRGFLWDQLDDEWREIRDPEREIRPGLTILLPAVSGGYSDLGWDADSKEAVVPLPPERKDKPEAVASDPNCAIPARLTIAEHTDHVCGELISLAASLGHLDGWCGQLANAARWHDAGKALPVAQKALYGSDPPDGSRLLAKSGRTGRLIYEGRPGFRHELGSALAVLQQRRDWPFAAAYLVAAHHGRVRLAIRALPGEPLPADPSIRIALGIQDGDALPQVDLGGGETCAPTVLDLSPMQLGEDVSWTARALKLLEDLGPFRLAYLESLLRAADVRASQKEARNG